MIKNVLLCKRIKWVITNTKCCYVTNIAEHWRKGTSKYKTEKRKEKEKEIEIEIEREKEREKERKREREREKEKEEKEKSKERINDAIKIENIKNEKELEKAFISYNEKKTSHLFRDYQNLINNNYIKDKCSKKELEECIKITKYVTNTTLLTHFLNKKNSIKEDNNEYKNMINNIYYVHNIERTKINKEEFITKYKNTNKCLKYLLENNIYKLIDKLKKCDLWNYREKYINQSYINYSIFFPISNMHIQKENADCYSYDCIVFFNVINKKNKNIFMEIIKKINYKLLNSAEINNVLVTMTILHHNNKSFCLDKGKSIEHLKRRDSVEDEIEETKEEKENKEEKIGKKYEHEKRRNKKKQNKYQNTVHSDITDYNPEYIKKKTFIDIFNNIYKCINSKIHSISFLYLYDYITLMTVNEIKNRDVYINVINMLSNYMNVINKITNKFSNDERELNKIEEIQIYEADDIVESKSAENDHKERTNKIDFCEGAQEKGFILKETTLTEYDNETINETKSNEIICENENFLLDRKNYKYIKDNLYQIKNIILSRVLLIYIMKYVYSHIDNNILYAHSDIICENLELLHQHLITNFIFTIGTCKHIDEFCMFMLAKFVQNDIHNYSPTDITIIVNTYADASLEDVSFYETICDHIKNNFFQFLATDIIKIIYAFSKSRIRDEELLKMAYHKINEYLEDRERKYSYSYYLKKDDLLNKKETTIGKNENVLLISKDNKKGRYIINKYLCAYAIIAAGKLDFFEGLNKMFHYLKESILREGIDIRGILWMPITITNFLSFECIFHFLPVYINLIYKAFKKTESAKLMTLLIRRHNILLHTIETGIIPKKYIDEDTLKKLYYVCKSKKDTYKEKVFVPDSSTFHIEVSNALLSLDIPHTKEVNIYPFTIDIFIQTSENSEDPCIQKDINEKEHKKHFEGGKNKMKTEKRNTINERDECFLETFETKYVKNKVKNKQEVYTDIPFS